MLRRWHRRALHKYGNHANPSLQRTSDLNTNPILRIAERSNARLPRYPVPANDRDERVAAGDRLLDNLNEVSTRLHAVKVFEYAGLAESVDQPVIEPPGMTRRVGSAITDEDQRHWRPSRP